MTNPTAVEPMIADQVTTESIKYAGSKRKLIPDILRLVGKTDAKTILDGFSGSTRVSQAFNHAGYQVIANDLAAWSEVLGTCYLLNTKPRSSYQELIDHLNAVPAKAGWFTKYYGGEAKDRSKVQSSGLKKPWQQHNTRKLDAIREEIDTLSLSNLERAVAITSLMLALDRVDSTLGHFVSYLKEWSARSFQELSLEVPQVSPNCAGHEVRRGDVFEVTSREVDLAYFDPPYGSNNEKMPPSRVRYAAYYHLWTSICLNDRPPLFGKALRRADSSDPIAATVFEEFRRNSDTGRFLAVEAIERLVSETRARWILLSYSSGGRATADELYQVLEQAGTILEIREVDHKRNVMSGMTWTHDWVREAQQPNREFLFLINKH